MATIKVYPRLDQKNKQGLVSIQLVAQNKGSKIKKTIKSIKIDPKNWDTENNRVTSGQANYQGVNRLITQSYNELEKIIMDLEYEGKGFNRDLIKAKVQGYDDQSVYDFWDRTIDARGSNIKGTTKKIYATALARLKSYRATLNFSEVTLEFLEGFESYLRLAHENKDNTIHKVIKCLKAIIKRANVTIGVRVETFGVYKMPYEDTHRDVINLEELDNLLALLYTEKILTCMGKASQQTLALFCFQALSGLRFSDAERFNVNEFVRGSTIRIGTDKTGREVYIPIHNRMLKLLNYVGYEFKSPTNQAFNRFIKSIALVAGIQINLTSHIAVHSFCVICLELGIPIEVISKLRGHASIKTTQIYAKVKNTLIDEQMKKWDKPDGLIKIEA
jgi:integrase